MLLFAQLFVVRLTVVYVILLQIHALNGKLNSLEVAEGLCPERGHVPVAEHANYPWLLLGHRFFVPMASKHAIRKYAEVFLGRPALDHFELDHMNLQVEHVLGKYRKMGFHKEFRQLCLSESKLYRRFPRNLLERNCYAVRSFLAGQGTDLKHFANSLDTIVWTDNHTAILVTKCINHKYYDWEVYSLEKELLPWVKEKILHIIQELGFSPYNVVYYDYKLLKFYEEHPIIPLEFPREVVTKIVHKPGPLVHPLNPGPGFPYHHPHNLDHYKYEHEHIGSIHASKVVEPGTAITVGSDGHGGGGGPPVLPHPAPSPVYLDKTSLDKHVVVNKEGKDYGAESYYGKSKHAYGSNSHHPHPPASDLHDELPPGPAPPVVFNQQYSHQPVQYPPGHHKNSAAPFGSTIYYKQNPLLPAPSYSVATSSIVPNPASVPETKIRYLSDKPKEEVAVSPQIQQNSYAPAAVIHPNPNEVGHQLLPHQQQQQQLQQQAQKLQFEQQPEKLQLLQPQQNSLQQPAAFPGYVQFLPGPVQGQAPGLQFLPGPVQQGQLYYAPTSPLSTSYQEQLLSGSQTSLSQQFNHPIVPNVNSK